MANTELLHKLQKIQEELKVPKDQYNSFGKYKYRSCESILESVKPLLQKYDCVLTLSDQMEHLGERYYVTVTVALSDGEGSISVTASAREAEVKKGMDDSQITGTASSYARKYALNGLFCIDDTKDTDTDDYAVEVAARAKTAGLQVQREAAQNPFPAILCKQCNKPIVDAKTKNGQIMPAQLIVQKWGGLCADCVKENASVKKEGESL